MTYLKICSRLYIQPGLRICMPLTHLNDLWTNVCITVSSHGTCFWERWPCATKYEKWEGWQSIRWKSSRMWPRFWTALNVSIWSFLKTVVHFLCFASCCYSLLYSSLSTQTSRVVAFTLFVFVSIFTPVSHLFLPRSRHKFCHFNVATMRPASATTAENDVTFVCSIPKRDRCLHTGHAFNCIPKVGQKLGSHPANRERPLQD